MFKCRMLEQKLTEAKSKKNTLKARAKSAQTTRQINDMIQGLNLNNSMAAFERMEEKVMALESESEATLQVCSAIFIFHLEEALHYTCLRSMHVRPMLLA